MTRYPRPTDDLHARFLSWRNIEEACPVCNGSGSRAYGNTSTWRRGVGGASITTDVCDACWGSGDKHRTWFNVRAHLDSVDIHIAESAVELLAKSAGVQISSTHPAIRFIIAHLEKLAGNRGAPAAPYLPEITRSIANTLRRAIGLPEAKECRGCGKTWCGTEDRLIELYGPNYATTDNGPKRITFGSKRCRDDYEKKHHQSEDP